MVILIKKKKKSNKKINTNRWVNVRLIFFGIIVTLAFFVVIGHLVILQFVQGKELSEKAYKQQVKNQIISPTRGTIYDSKGEILAQSISVDTVSLNPGKVTYLNSKKVPDDVIATGISNIFDITYDEMIENLKSDKSVIVIAKKVETKKVDELKKWMAENNISAGINIDEDSKRYYPFNNLASNLIGFCGTDNTGQTGLEERWNNILTGTAGKVVTATDVAGNAISDEDEQYVPSENGSNIYLTIDSTIQSIAEKYLEQVVKENSTSTGGNVIIMNPQNGEILAMATYPNFNLNEPSNFVATGLSEDEWNALEKQDKSATLLNLWKNRAVSDVYEPGSTFKLITAAVGLEEGLVEKDKPGDFYCSGSYLVTPEEPPIACWRSYNPHGSQTLREALCNSCNPAFMQLGQRIGARTLYKYFDAFGLFDVVGNDIAKAYPGKFHELEKIASVELATTSFGQRFTISPLQLITAVSAICNDGTLVKPKIVKQIENTDTGSIEVVETEKVRQVISKKTASDVKDMMQSVVEEGTGRQAKIEGYSIGGKSGTSEPTIANQSDGYVASFIAISPIENTQVVCLVAVYGLQEHVDHQGGQIAGPIAHKILSQVLPILGITSSSTPETEKEQVNEEKLISVPNVKGQTISEANGKLQSLGFNVKYPENIDVNASVVFEQVPKPGATLTKDSIICLYSSAEEPRVKVVVPNIKEMPVDKASNILRANNLNIRVEGTKGIVSSQEPTYETEVEEGTIIDVVIKEKLTDAQ